MSKDKYIQIRVSEKDKEKIKKIAKTSGKSISQFLLDPVLTNADTNINTDVNTQKEVLELLGFLNDLFKTNPAALLKIKKVKEIVFTNERKFKRIEKVLKNGRGS